VTFTHTLAVHVKTGAHFSPRGACVQESLRVQLSEAGGMDRDVAVAETARALLQQRRADVIAATQEMDALERRIEQQFETFNKAQETDALIVSRQRVLQAFAVLCEQFETLHTTITVSVACM
jgi:hypothetical protein